MNDRSISISRSVLNGVDGDDATLGLAAPPPTVGLLTYPGITNIRISTIIVAVTKNIRNTLASPKDLRFNH